MNLREFTEAVDEKAGKLDREGLLCFLHIISRKVPEEGRDPFLEALEYALQGFGTGEEKEKVSLEAAVKRADEEEIREEMVRLRKLFDRDRKSVV